MPPKSLFTSREKASKAPKVSVVPPTEKQAKEKGRGAYNTRYNAAEIALLSNKIRETEDNLPVVQINLIRYNLMSAQDISNLATQNGQPIVCTNELKDGVTLGTVNSPLMGITETNYLCSTCQKTSIECPGHYGMIDLGTIIYHPLYLHAIVRVLNCVCSTCSQLFITGEEFDKGGYSHLRGMKRLTEMQKRIGQLQCRSHRDHEGEGEEEGEEKVGPTVACTKNPLYVLNGTKDGIATKVKDGAEPIHFPILNVWNILNNVSSDDAKRLGFTEGSHPRNMILSRILVIPPTTRPPVADSGVVRQHKLTDIYNNIVRQTNILREILSRYVGSYHYVVVTEQLEEGEVEREREEISLAKIPSGAGLGPLERNYKDVIKNIYEEYRKLVVGGGTNKAGKGPEEISLSKLMMGKTGYVRGAGGKRVNWSGRSVLSNDPSLRFGEIGIPKYIASELTKNVVVAPHNHGELQALFRAGKVKYIVFGGGEMKGKRFTVYKELRDTYTLHNGDIVERHLMNGDFVIFNRQPTLHYGSLMSHKVVIHDGYTVNLHMALTTPANADFDGDEGNIYFITTAIAEAEVAEILYSRKCLLGTQGNAPMMSVVYDGLTGCYILTQHDTWLSKETFMDCYDLIKNAPSLEDLQERAAKYGVPFRKNDVVLKGDKKASANMVSSYVITGDKERYDKLVNRVAKAEETYDSERISIANKRLKDHQDKYRKEWDELLTRFHQSQRNYSKSVEEGEESGEFKEERDRSRAELKEWEKNNIEWKEGEELYSGRILFSALLPSTFNYRKIKEGEELEIREGILINGVVKKAHIGVNVSGTIVHSLGLMSLELAGDFITYATHVADLFLKRRGFSIGIDACMVSDTEKQNMADAISKMKLRVDAMGMVPVDRDPAAASRHEEDLKAVIKTTNVAAAKLVKGVSSKNPLVIMSESGAKGNTTNLSQIMFHIGQQLQNNQRIDPSGTKTDRCLPGFLPGDSQPESRGLCIESFVEGNSVAGAFSAQVSGRVGMVDTATNTGRTGTVQRHFEKRGEGITTSLYNTVQDGDYTISWVYGGDGLDGSRLTVLQPSGMRCIMNVRDVFDRMNRLYGYT